MKRAMAIALLIIIAGLICVAVGTAIASRNTNTVSAVAGPKESLTLEEIQSLSVPKNFIRTVIENDEVKMKEFANFLPSDTFDAIMMELYPYKSITVVSSSIEDDMIYTILTVEKEDGKKAEMLLINNPTTLNYVAGTWTYAEAEGNTYTHYEYGY